MAGRDALPPLKPLHSDQILVTSKLVLFAQMTTEALIDSLCPPRLHVDSLQQEIIQKAELL
jgi:hypothetical protein